MLCSWLAISKDRRKWSESEKNLYSGVAASLSPVNYAIKDTFIHTMQWFWHAKLPLRCVSKKLQPLQEQPLYRWSSSTTCTLFWQSLTELKHIISPPMPSLQEWMSIHAAVSSASPAAVETWMTQKQLRTYFTKLAPSLRTTQSNAIYVKG